MPFYAVFCGSAKRNNSFGWQEVWRPSTEGTEKTGIFSVPSVPSVLLDCEIFLPSEAFLPLGESAEYTDKTGSSLCLPLWPLWALW